MQIFNRIRGGVVNTISILVPDFWKTQLKIIKEFLKTGKSPKEAKRVEITQPVDADDFIHEHIQKYLNTAYESILDSPILIEKEKLDINLAMGFAQTYELMGHWSTAIEYYQRAAKLASLLDIKSTKAETYRKIGRLKRNMWNIKGALKAFESSLRIYKSYEDYKGIASSMNSMGTAYLEIGKLQKAEEKFKSALDFAEGINDSKLIAQINNNLGALANIRGEWDNAILHYQECLPRFEKIKHSRGVAQTYHNLGMTFFDKEDPLKANEYFNKSLEFSYIIGDVGLIANTYLNKIEVYIYTQDLNMALVFCKKALESFMQFSDQAGVAEVCKYVGIILSKKLSWGLARQYFQLSLKINKRIENILNLAETQYALGMAYRMRNNRELEFMNLSLENFKILNARKEIAKVRKVISSLSN